MKRKDPGDVAGCKSLGNEGGGCKKADAESVLVIVRGPSEIFLSALIFL